MFGPMPPSIELAECIKQAQILVIVRALDIFADRTAQRHHPVRTATELAAGLGLLNHDKVQLFKIGKILRHTHTAANRYSISLWAAHGLVDRPRR